MRISGKIKRLLALPKGEWPDSRLSPVRSAKDNRGPAWGLGRLIIASFWVCSIWFFYVETTTVLAQLATYEQNLSKETIFLGKMPPLLLFIGISIALTHNGRKMRKIAGACLILTNLGLLLGGFREIETASQIWNNLGSTFYYLPLGLSIIGMIWLWWSNPRRIVELAEKF